MYAVLCWTLAALAENFPVELLLCVFCLCGVFTFDRVPPVEVCDRATEVTFEGVVMYPCDDFLSQLFR